MRLHGLRPYIQLASRKYGINPRVIRRQIKVESGGNANAVSSAGARGLTQFLPDTAKEYNVQFGDSEAAKRSQILGEAHYLHDLGFSHDPLKALASYAAGPGNYQAGLSYAHKILDPVNDPTREATGHSGGIKVPNLKPVNFQAPQTSNIFDTLLQLNQFSVGGVDPNDPATQNLNLLASLVDTQAHNTEVKPMTSGLDVKVPKGSTPSGKHPKGVTKFEGTPVAAWIKPWLVYARKHGWKGSISSGFRSYADQVRIWNSGVRPAARPGTSNHEGSTFPRGAVDVTDAATLDRILRRARSPLKWAGSKDPVHFSHPHNGGY